MNLRIKELRKYAALSQTTLGDMVGVGQQAVSRWESGASLPDTSILPQLANIFQTSVDYILGISDCPAITATSQLPDDEQNILNCYRNLSEEGKDYIRQTLIMAAAVYKKCCPIPDEKAVSG